MTSAAYIGAERVNAVSFANRGLAYGDGLFETMRVHRGVLPLWPRHLARLREGATRLGIGLPDVAFIESRIAEMIGGTDAGVLKLLLTRGDGGRGYAPPGAAPARSSQPQLRIGVPAGNTRRNISTDDAFGLTTTGCCAACSNGRSALLSE